MKMAMAVALLAASGCSTTHRPLATAELERYPRAQAAPLDVQRFIARWTDCARSLARDPATREEVEEIGEAQHRFCAGIDARARSLRERYAGNAEVRALLGGFERLGH